jgi:hypothetical protein
MASKSSQALALPPEVVLSIQNILDLKQSDPLDTLGEFDPIATLNTHFPDGKLNLRGIAAERYL